MSNTERTTRADRIASAQARVDELEPLYTRSKAEYDDAIVDLNRAKASYDIGERVHVCNTCRRGCCIEWEYDGVIEAEGSHGRSYAVRRDDGGLSEHVSIYDMTRKPS